jgi:hypothetical protein
MATLCLGLLLFTIGRLVGAAVLTAMPGITTPSPVQPGFIDNCNSFAYASPGDTCYSMGEKYGLDINAFLALNPQIGGIQSCSQNLWADYWYCVHSIDGSDMPATLASSRPAATACVTTSSESSPQQQATVTIMSKPPMCPTGNDCWRAYRKAAAQVRPSYSSWCSSLLTESVITQTAYENFPGIPNMVKNQCASLGPANVVITSYCACFTARQMGP